MKTQYPPNADSESTLYSSDAFRMYCFKVLPCSKRFCHDWVTCPFAHPAEKAKRRDPRAFTYTGVACPDQKKNATCPRGDSCTFAHNVFEYHLHPSRYRTQLCNDGANCARKICFFAHSMDELRVSSVKVVPPDSAAAAANKLGSPSGSGDFDADPFGGQNDDVLGALRGQRSSTSPVSPLYADSWDSPSGGNTDGPTRRSSLQLQQKQKQQHQRMSLDQGAMRPQAGHQAALRQQRNSTDLASELQLQQLQLSAMKAQLQLQQSALQSLGVGQPDINAASVAQLAQALAQLQMASGLASPEQLLPALQQQQMVPNLTQVLVQQMLMQQQAQAHVQAAQAQAAQQAQGQLLQQLQNQVLNAQAQAASGMPDLAAAGLSNLLMPSQQSSMSANFAMPSSGGGGSTDGFNGLRKMNSLPGPDLSALQGMSKMPSPDLASLQALCVPNHQASTFGAGSQGVLSPTLTFDSMFSGQSAFAGHSNSGSPKDGGDAAHPR